MKYWSSSRVGAVPQAGESQHVSRKKESNSGSRFQRKKGITMEVGLDRKGSFGFLSGVAGIVLVKTRPREQEKLEHPRKLLVWRHQ
jgi:hypothetical protein